GRPGRVRNEHERLAALAGDPVGTGGERTPVVAAASVTFAQYGTECGQRCDQVEVRGRPAQVEGQCHPVARDFDGAVEDRLLTGGGGTEGVEAALEEDLCEGLDLPVAVALGVQVDVGAPPRQKGVAGRSVG